MRGTPKHPRVQLLTWEAWRDAFLTTCESMLARRWADLNGAEAPLRDAFDRCLTPRQAVARWAYAANLQHLMPAAREKAARPAPPPKPPKPKPRKVRPVNPRRTRRQAAAAVLGRTLTPKKMASNKRNAQLAGRTPGPIYLVAVLSWLRATPEGQRYRFRARAEARRRGRRILERRPDLDSVTMTLLGRNGRVYDTLTVSRQDQEPEEQEPFTPVDPSLEMAPELDAREDQDDDTPEQGAGA